jgi:FkbM family methyltransferase
MDKRWHFAVKHGWASAVGLLRVLASQPTFAVALLERRIFYFITRRLRAELLSPKSFLIDTPDALIAYWSMFVERELHDPAWIQSLETKKKPLIVDVGANAGVFSHYVHCLQPEAQFVAFEPLPPMVKRLNAMKERTGINLQIEQKAVSNTCGEAWFETAHGYDGTSKLSNSNDSTGNRFRVETTTLDDALGGRDIALMKIDVEGFECEVIQGGPKSLARTDFVIMEAEDPKHLARIKNALGSGWAVDKVGATDYLFRRLTK